METETEIEPDIRKIAVLRANAVGDFVVLLPALTALRDAYPSAEIVLLGKPWHVSFLTGRPGPVDRVIVVPPYPGVRDEPGMSGVKEDVDRFFAAMAAEQFDLALQVHGGGRNSNPFVLRLGARLTAGLRTPDAVPLDRWVPYYFYQQEIMRYLEVVSLVGARTGAIVPQLAVTEADLDESLSVVGDDGQPFVVIHPGASSPRRRWPVERYAAVGDALAAAGARVVVSGIEPERDLVAGVLGAMRAPAINVCGKLSLNGLVGLLARSSLLVANDSGPRHLAVAVDTPTVGIFWCGNVITFGPYTRTRHRVAISWQVTCPVCGSEECGHQPSFVDRVPVEEVLEMALDVYRIETGRKRSPNGHQVDGIHSGIV